MHLTVIKFALYNSKSCPKADIIVHSFRIFKWRLSKSTTRPTHRRSRHSTDTVSEFHAEAPQATASEGLVQGPYMATSTRFEPTSLRTKGDKSTNEPPRLT